jgi:chromosome segregation ATPase
MDINQAMKMIEWLDEERRRNKSQINQLEEQLSGQQETIDQLNRRLNSVESENTVFQTKLEHNRTGGPGDNLLETVRQEMRNLLEQQEAKRLTAEREVEKRHELAREGLMRPVRDLTERLANIEAQLQDLPGFQLERARTGEAVASVQQQIEDIKKRFDEPDRRLTFLEEQRRQDNRRLAEIQSELPEMQKQIDAVRPKVGLIEELALRNERKINETQTAESSRRDQMQQFVDQQTLMLQQRDQQVQALLDRFGEQDSAMQRNLERFEGWSETHREMKRIIEDFERIGDRLERRINEVAEMQRLSEERFRQEWNDWRTDDQKRFKQFTLANDDVWRNHDKEFERHLNRVDSIAASIPPLRESISRLWELERARAEMYRERYQALLMQFDTQENIRATTTGTVPAVHLPETPPTNGADTLTADDDPTDPDPA